MRINLVTPFAEKDAAKALGARWDSAKKVWYIQDVADLTPFARWIPDLQAAMAGTGTGNAAAAAPSPGRPRGPVADKRPASGGVSTQPRTVVPHCGCDVLPWVDCEHTTPAA